MSRWFVALIAITGLLVFSNTSHAQENGAQAGRFELLINPVGATFWTEGTDDSGEPDFGQYNVALSGTWNFHPRWAAEGEFASGIGVEQRLTFPGVGSASLGDVTPPSSLTYNGNLVFYPWTLDHAAAPYVTGGVGVLTLLERKGFTDENQTYFTANVGGGLKYFFTPRWGLRGDYRFFWVNSETEGPGFFGRADDRYGHRISGGVVLNLVK